jgi:hypothetical protein
VSLSWFSGTLYTGTLQNRLDKCIFSHVSQRGVVSQLAEAYASGEPDSAPVKEKHAFTYTHSSAHARTHTKELFIRGREFRNVTTLAGRTWALVRIFRSCESSGPKKPFMLYTV